MSPDYPACSIQIKLKQRQTAAELAYRSAIDHMKESRGVEYERAWRLVEHRRISLQRVPGGAANAGTKPRVGAHSADVAPAKAKSGHKATPTKKANNGAKSAKSPKQKARGAREGSKTAQVLGLLKRSGGSSITETLESHRLEGALGGRVPIGRRWQEDGTDGYVRKGRRPGAPLLDQRLNPAFLPRAGTDARPHRSAGPSAGRCRERAFH